MICETGENNHSLCANENPTLLLKRTRIFNLENISNYEFYNVDIDAGSFEFESCSTCNSCFYVRKDESNLYDENDNLLAEGEYPA